MNSGSPSPGEHSHRALEHPFTLGVDETDDSQLAQALAPFAVRSSVQAPPSEPEASITSYSLVRWDSQWLVRRDDTDLHSGTIGHVLGSLITSINVAAIGSVPSTPVVHAGAVAYGDRALVLPADAGAGKSTLTAALCATGHPYLTDEAVPVLADGTVRPYAKPVVVHPDSTRVLGSVMHAAIRVGDTVPSDQVRLLDPHRFPGGVRDRPLPIGFVVCPRYRHGAQLELTEMTRAEVVAALASNLFNLRELGRAALETVELASRGVRGARLVHGDARDAVAAIDRWAQR